MTSDESQAEPGRGGWDVSNQRMPLWSICTQADPIYANIILPKIVPINFTPIAHQWGHEYSPAYGCMRIFGREKPYICVIGTISGYIWQYICGRPYAVSGSAYSASLLQGGPLIPQFSWRYTTVQCSALQYTLIQCRTALYNVVSRSIAVQCNVLQLWYVHCAVDIVAELWSWGA